MNHPVTITFQVPLVPLHLLVLPQPPPRPHPVPGHPITRPPKRVSAPFPLAAPRSGLRGRPSALRRAASRDRPPGSPRSEVLLAVERGVVNVQDGLVQSGDVGSAHRVHVQVNNHQHS